jgi:hypothetical protein
MKSIRQKQFENIERREKQINYILIGITYLLISASGSLFLMAWEGIL